MVEFQYEQQMESYNILKITENYVELIMRTKVLKRIPLEKLMDLKVDYAFKQLFGSEKNKEITVGFLIAILQRTGRDRIKDITFSNIEGSFGCHE